jgi:hypothetical protein
VTTTFLPVSAALLVVTAQRAGERAGVDRKPELGGTDHR